MVFRFGDGVDSDDVLVCSVFLVELVFVGLHAVVLHVVGVAFLFEVFFEPDEHYGLVAVHALAE